MFLVTRSDDEPTHARVARVLFFACGIWLIGLTAYFVVLRPPLLPENLRYIGAGAGDVHTTLPGVGRWLRRVFTVLGGFIVGTGLLTLIITTSPTALWGPRRQLVMFAAGIVTVGSMIRTNLMLVSDFKWLALIPSLVWLTGTLLLLTVTRASPTRPAIR